MSIAPHLLHDQQAKLLQACEGIKGLDGPLFVGQPNLPDSEPFLARVRGMLERKYFSNNGPMVQELEARIGQITGVAHVVAMANATLALELLIKALGLQGDIIVPAFTFIASAHAITANGGRPIFCDIDPNTHNLDPQKVSALISPSTQAIMGVHLWGRPCPIEPLARLADQHRIPLIYDAAHAFGCSVQGKPIGQFGRAEVFSFHATKFINSCEGGAVLTHDGQLAEKLRLMRNFGFRGFDDVGCWGTNAKMSEISAAMGLCLLDKMDQIVDHNRENYKRYQQAAEGIPGLQLIPYQALDTPNYQYCVFEIDAQDFGMERDTLLQILHQKGIIARRYFYPGCHRMSPYRDDPKNSQLSLDHTEDLVGRVMELPNGLNVSPIQIAAIMSIIQQIRAQAQKVSGRL